MGRTLSKIPYYDTDHALLDYLNDARAAKYIALGTASAVRSKDGKIRRLIRIGRARTYGSAAASIASMRGAASRTTQRVTSSSGELIAPPWVREHR